MRVILIAMCLCVKSFGQVGINTVKPRGALDVNGDVISKQLIFPKNLDPVVGDLKSTYNLLVQNTNTNNIEILDVGTTNNTGIAAIVTYELISPDGDWVANFNTKIDASKYALVVLSGYFSVDILGTASESSLPGVGARVINNEWILNADYPAQSNVTTTETKKWLITCAIFPVSYVKIFPGKEVDMQMSNTNLNLDEDPILK